MAAFGDERPVEDDSSVRALSAYLREGRVVALTGAGVSTESGIPDYRSPAALARVRRPIHGPEFVRSAALRRRYWARAMVGWERFRLAHGAYPASLSELAPALIDRLPADVVNGEPYRYHQTDDGGYVLYSVAVNLVDDGGETKGNSAAQKLDWVWKMPGK